MATLNRGRSFVESLVGDNSALKNLFVGNQYPKKELERTLSGNKKWIKELSSLANIVVGRCCRYASFSFVLVFTFKLCVNICDHKFSMRASRDVELWTLRFLLLFKAIFYNLKTSHVHQQRLLSCTLSALSNSQRIGVLNICPRRPPYQAHLRRGVSV